MNEDHSFGIYGGSNMKLSDDTRVLLFLLDTDVFSERARINELVLESV